MTTQLRTSSSAAAAGAGEELTAAGVLADLSTIGARALRLTLRDFQAVIPSLFVGVFFYWVQVGTLQDVFQAPAGGAGDYGVVDYRAFLLPMAIVFAITGVSRAMQLVTDIQTGYFDRLLVTPVSRPTLLLGLMAADAAVVVALSAIITGFGLAIGVSFASGVLGVLVFIALATIWALAFAGIPYAVALRTGNPAAVGVSWILFMPFSFLTTAFVPKEAMTDWMATIVAVNPATYLLEAMRSLLFDGWDLATVGAGFVAVSAVFALTFGAALWALGHRVRKG